MFRNVNSVLLRLISVQKILSNIFSNDSIFSKTNELYVLVHVIRLHFLKSPILRFRCSVVESQLPENSLIFIRSKCVLLFPLNYLKKKSLLSSVYNSFAFPFTEMYHLWVANNFTLRQVHNTYGTFLLLKVTVRLFVWMEK